MPDLNELAAASFDGKRRYSDVVQFVHVYVVEPHPAAPDADPYLGVPGMDAYSSVAQPRDYAGRVALARSIEPLITGDQILLVDDLTPGGLVNPVWGTYGPNPNGVHLIRQDGTIAKARLWLNTQWLKQAIDELTGD